MCYIIGVIIGDDIMRTIDGRTILGMLVRGNNHIGDIIQLMPYSLPRAEKR